MYEYKFEINNSKTRVIENGMDISTAISSTPNYSTIIIYPGLYQERLTISTPTRLIGIGNPIIDAGGIGAVIRLDSTDNVITGLTLINSGSREFSDGGIIIPDYSFRNIIVKNNIYNTICGIWIYKSDSNTIINNTIYNNDDNGITILNSNSNTITDNIIYNNINGIYADRKSDKNIIKNNNLYDNIEYGVLIEDYNNLNNICEYNHYKNNKMSCSNAFERGDVPIRVTTPLPSNTANPDDWWTDCNGNPKCYQS